MDGVISERTIRVSSSSPMPMVVPPCPTFSRSPGAAHRPDDPGLDTGADLLLES